MADALFTGPWFGEFGHEIGFAAMARKRAESYKRVIVCTRPSSHALYADFATEFRPHTIECMAVTAHATADTMPRARVIDAWTPHDLDVDVMRGVSLKSRLPTKYVRYGRRQKHWACVIVMHARNRPHVPMRNWPASNWNWLVRKILKEGLAPRVACIGIRKHALTAEGAVDLRDAALSAQMDILASARLIIGPSSGPMHLATLCGKRRDGGGCPQVVWCGGPSGERRETGGRYERAWNPFGTPVERFDAASWQPSRETVWSHLIALMERLNPR